MAEEKLYNKYFDKLDSLKERIGKDSEKILSAIDPEKLIDDPMEYLNSLGMMFFEAHKKEMGTAIKLGEGRARKVLNEIKKS